MKIVFDKKYLVNERKFIYEEIDKINNFLSCWLISCLNRQRTIFYRPSVNDVIARKYVNRLEELTNQLHLINDILEDKITFSNVSIKFESFKVK